ncbi:3-keto-disaccharide hydrolase [Lutibacter citreus]|uniref:3-keto-disaccharide hydrolase n=1 Tax=Lutibacter citreus TaxID=2138210 RepID=UPI000DBE6D14|nr:DUF1080 domain-containing protein [Lutibacter citreus]
MNNLKIAFIIGLALILNSCSSVSTKKEKSEWENLFNGKNLDGWVAKIYNYDLGVNFANTFRVNNGVIEVNYDGYNGKLEDRFGHLFYKKSFSSFHLQFEYKFTDEWLKDGPIHTFRNSGVMFHSQDPKTILKNQNWPISIEYQLLADADEGDRPTGNMCSPATEVYYKGEISPRHCISSSSKTYPCTQWVKGEIIVYKDSIIKHLVDDKVVLEYSKPFIGGKVVKNFDPAIKIDGKALTEGYIGLQSEGQGVLFKNIKIKELN